MWCARVDERQIMSATSSRGLERDETGHAKQRANIFHFLGGISNRGMLHYNCNKSGR